MKLPSIFILSLLGVGILISCEGLVEGLNDDPNNPTTASYQNILTGAEVGNIILQTGETARRAGIFCGYYTGIQRQHQGFDSYTVTTSDFDNLWDDAFVNTLRNAKEAQEAAAQEGIEGVTAGIAQVIQAMAYGTEASLFGDIPFDEAADISIEHPKFEAQVQVYQKIHLLLDEAILNLSTGTGRPTSGSDIFFDGNPDAWTEVAYTLKARYFLHVKNYEAAYAAAANGIQSMASSLYAPHGSGADESNLTYQFFAVQVRGADLITSDFMTSLVAPDPATNPQIANYRGNTKTNETGRYKFYFQINDVGTQPNTISGLAAQEASAPMVTYQENLLILAEAGLRSQSFGIGLSHLNEFRAFMSTGGYLTSASPADILYDPYVSADFDNGGMENPDGLSSENALLREILQERYVTLFGQIEGFCDTRRTLGEGTVRVPVAPNTGNELPQRFIYPQSEIDRNKNVPNPIPGFFEATMVNQ
ncbi:SusD/RagB family nutrient-binding outer membrane lipoprotein [Marinoscillum sp. 108]|uniref:SusD/RagB family nutrient-binding outer membrane lipoprotein n=1 Tax=Marinoscillum sp. 108 TaxID=2653151 RepID=UPI0012F2C845|nr:SusD/RagB family nutrient-binding outer membrane lipoprotein [Marinoscillum sp. 108]VXD20757.1 SusD/RagB family nutrient-binding outer membrane lipoprotein [Marinoscillum sp. 108]